MSNHLDGILNAFRTLDRSEFPMQSILFTSGLLESLWQKDPLGHVYVADVNPNTPESPDIGEDTK